MMQWMLFLGVIGVAFALINSRGKDLGQILSSSVQWTGWLWIIVFGVMFLNEILRSAGAPNINVFQSGTWQPLGPVVLGAILLVLWHRRQRSS